MDRQTIRYPDGAVELKCSVNDAVMRLAAYEDTGLEPEQIKHIAEIDNEYVKASEEGRLIVLPCKVGNTVWRIVGRGTNRHRSVQQRKVLAVTIYHTGDIIIHTDGAANRFGKTVFLTREEAEAALGGDHDAAD